MRSEDWIVEKVFAVRNDLVVIAKPGPSNRRNCTCLFRFASSDEQLDKLAPEIRGRMDKAKSAESMKAEFCKFADESRQAVEAEKHRLAKVHGIEIEDFESGLFFS